MVDVGCQKNGCFIKAGWCAMIVGDGDWEGMHMVCLQWPEVDSRQVEVLNSKLEEAHTAVWHLQRKKVPTLSKQQRSSKSCCNMVNAGERHVWDELRGWWIGVDDDTQGTELIAMWKEDGWILNQMDVVLIFGGHNKRSMQKWWILNHIGEMMTTLITRWRGPSWHWAHIDTNEMVVRTE